MISEEFNGNHSTARGLHMRAPIAAYTVGGYARDHEHGYGSSLDREERSGYDEACHRITRLRSAVAKAYLKSKERFRKRTRVKV